MATVYSGWSAKWRPKNSSYDKHYRARVDYWVSGETDTTITYSAILYVNIDSTVNASYSGNLYIGGGSWSGSCSTVLGESKTVTCVGTHSITFNKGETPTTASIRGGVRSSNGDWTGATVTASVNVSIPAKRYAISYNPNGGTASIATQKKTHGVALTLSSVIPTLDGYDFVEWNTSADRTGTAYQSGGTMPADVNQDTTLYAIWHISYQPPQVDNLRAYRTTSDASGRNPNVKSDGTRCYCDFEYTPSVDPDATTDSITIQFGESTPVNASVYSNLRYGYSEANHLPATQSEAVTTTVIVTDYLGNEYTYTYATYISTENYIFDAFKDSRGNEEYQSFAIGGKARDFSDSNRNPKGNFDVYIDMSIVLNDGVQITDTGTTIAVTKTGNGETDDYLLAKAIAETFSYAEAKEILEV